MKMEHLKRRYQWLFSGNASLRVDEGWTWLLSGLCHALEQYDGGVLITGVGQSLGELSIAFIGGDEQTEYMIRAVQLASTQVCQLCAATDEVGGTFGPSIYTLCGHCWRTNEKYHIHLLNLNSISEVAATKIEAGLLVMEDGWFKKRLQKLIS